MEIPDDPLCRLRFYDISYNGDSNGHFYEAVIAVEASHGDIHGDYSLRMYTDDPTDLHRMGPRGLRLAAAFGTDQHV